MRNNNTYEFEDFRLDAAHLMLYRDSRTISLKPKVVETLVALVERRGEVVSNAELMDRLWADSFVEESNLTQNIYLLRKTLGSCADGKPFIENFSRRGYRFNGELRSPVESRLLLATHTRTQTVVDETFESVVGLSRRNWAILAVAVIVVLGAITYTVRNIGSNAPLSDVKSTAVSPFQSFNLKRHSETGDVRSAKISPDGKLIAYSDSTNSIWLRNIVTGSNVKISEESGAAESVVAAVSPDANHVYIVRHGKDKKSAVIKLSLFGGAVEQKIVDDFWSDLSLSPDGRQLSFVRNDVDLGAQSLIVSNTDGTGERTVATAKGGMWFGMYSQSTAWSPDGSQIACTGGITAGGNAMWNVRIFRVDDGAEILSIKSSSGTRWLDAVAWLPSGDNLLVISGDSASQGQIYRHTISTGEWRRVTNDLSDYVNLSVTADGKTIVSTQQENPGNLWVMPAEGDVGEARQITFGRNLMTDTTGISWTPDGKIVYATNAGGKWEIWKIDEDGTNQKQLTQNCAGNDSCSQPNVTPDGRYVVFQANLGGIANLWRMETDGSNAIRLTSEGGFYPSLTSDGRFVVYTRWMSDMMTLWQVPIEGGEPVQISKITKAGAATVSPDGSQMVFHYNDKVSKQQTCVAPLGAEVPEKCFGNAGRSFPRWTTDGKAFYYLDHGYKGIWKQPLNGEREPFLSFPGERTNNFAFSPDRRKLAVARSKQFSDIVALTEN